MTKILTLLRKLLPIGGAVASGFFPAFAPLINVLINHILLAQNQFGTGKGDEKRQSVLQNALASAPVYIASFEAALGKELVDENKFASGLGKVIDGIVEILNSFEALPSQSKSQPQ
jgi:hypothetical protein